VGVLAPADPHARTPRRPRRATQTPSRAARLQLWPYFRQVPTRGLVVVQPALLQVRTTLPICRLSDVPCRSWLCTASVSGIVKIAEREAAGESLWRKDFPHEVRVRLAETLRIVSDVLWDRADVALATAVTRIVARRVGTSVPAELAQLVRCEQTGIWLDWLGSGQWSTRRG
jgi:hypothetical protein